MKINVQLEKRIFGQATMEVPDELIDGVTKRTAYSRMKKEATKAFEAGQLEIEWNEEDAEEFVEGAWLADISQITIVDGWTFHVKK